MEETKVLHKKKLLAPKLRFKDFDDSWNQKKLNTLAEINPSNKNLPDKFIYIDLESVVKGELLKENEILKDGAPSRAQRYLQQNDILFQMVRPYQMNNLFFDKKGNYVASTGYAQIRTKENSKYIYQYLHLQSFVDKVIEKCTGTSYPSINSKDLGNLQIGIPSLPEQEKIAAFLTAVDEKIQQLKRKKQLLTEYKKGVLQQLFSGKLRFKDENGKAYPKWEEKKLGEVARFLKGKGIAKTDIDLEGHTECIRYGQLYTDYKETISNVISRTSIPNEDLVLSVANDVIIPASGETQLDIATASCVLRAGIALGSDLNIIRTQMNGVFLSYYLNTKKKTDIARLSQGITVVHLYPSQLGLLKLLIPCLEEQKKIADFLSAIDVKINGVAEEIDATTLFKKGLLQQMFV